MHRWRTRQGGRIPPGGVSDRLRTDCIFAVRSVCAFPGHDWQPFEPIDNPVENLLKTCW